MDDLTVQNHIEQLVAEEHELLASGRGDAGLDDAGHQRLAAVRVELDRYWDLLRQRRAHEEFGLDPAEASLRPGDTVENYEG